VVGKLDPEERVLPKFFKETSSDPYIRPDYKLVYVNGNQKIFDNYSDTLQTWWNTSKQLLDHVEVLDHKQTKIQGGGFN
jgi:hypothetical protein